MTMPISIISKLTCKSGKNTEMEAALNAMRRAVLDNEPGTLLFINHRSRKNPEEYYIVEQYEDEAAADRHDESAAFKEAIEQLLPNVAGPAEHTGLDVIEGSL